MSLSIVLFILSFWGGEAVDLPTSLAIYQSVSASTTDQDFDYYATGMQFLESGDTLNALATWQQAREGSPDPRIGIAYIELATVVSHIHSLEKATEMYYWGLSGDSYNGNKETLVQEVERLEPLLDAPILKRWRRMANESDSRLLRELIGFWKYQDPTPSTIQNERLLEHWERVAFAREHFIRSKQDPYGTDDRGLVYVRYGRADLIRSGQLIYNSSEAYSRITEIIMSNSLDPSEPVSNVVIGNIINKWVKTTREFYTFPEYEIWVYEDLNPESADPTIFVFGTKGETGSFEQLQSIEDFIPDLAFSMSEAWISRTEVIGMPPDADHIRPGLILQMLYYNQLATIDMYFGQMLQTIERRAYDRGPLSLSLGQEMKTLAIADMTEAIRRSPREDSKYEDGVTEITISVNQYRLLDEQNHPVLETFVQSRPQTAFLTDYLSNYSETGISVDQITQQVRQQAMGDRGHYRLLHSARIFGEYYLESDNNSSSAPVVIAQDARSKSFLRVRNGPSGTRQLFSAELFNTDTTSRSQGAQGPFPNELRGVGKTELRQPQPLNVDPDELQMGDLILGYGMQPSDEQPWPFTITHDRKIPAGEALAVHVEAYHLRKGSDGTTDFTLTYEVLERNPGIIRWLDRYRTAATEVTLNLETDSGRYTENLEIRTRELDSGTYLLRLVAADRISGQQVTRELEFEVVE